MATNKDFNVSPWYDDYDDAAGQNGDHYRVLYRPGRAIQAREATQSQTILQRQIERFGEHIFQQGSIVSGANHNFNREAYFTKLESQYNNVDITVSNFLNQDFIGKTSLTRGNIYHTETLTTTDANAIYVNYTSGNQIRVLIFTGTITGTFLAGETVTGGTSTSTGIIRRWDATNKIMWIAQTATATSGVFTTGETVTSTTGNGTDSNSGASGALATTNFNTASFRFFPGEEIISAVPKLTATVTPTGTFEIGDMVTGSSSSATGQVVKFDSTAKELQIIPVTGTFTTSDTVTSVATSGAFKVSGTASMVVTAVANLTTTYNAIVGGGSASSISSQTGLGMLFSIDEGIIFVNGHFVKVAAQTISLTKFSQTGNYRIGLIMTETTPDSNDDSSLLDNAQGFANENAPGADRYKITLTLAKLSTSEIITSGDEKWIEIGRTSAKALREEVNFPIYSELGKTLARRTNDESGNYTIRDFRHHMEDHTTDTTKFISVLGPGLAYLQGYEHETVAPFETTHDRARTFDSVDNGDTLMQYGSYVLMDTVNGSASDFYDVTTHSIVEFHCVLNTNITLTDELTYLRTLAGTARIRHFGQGTADPADSSSPGTEDYRMYLYDMKFHSLLGTAQAGSSTTITLEAAEDNTDDAYNGATIEIIGGTGSGQARVITNYVGSSNVATVSTWSTNPSSSSIYRITYTLKNIQSIVAVTAYTSSTAPVVVEAAADIAVAGRYGGVAREATYKVTTVDGNAFGDVKLLDTDVNGLVFPIGEANIKEITTASATYQFQRKFTGTFSAGALTLTAPSNEEFYTGSSALSDSNKNEAYVLVHKSGSASSTGLAAGDLIDMTATSRTITPNESARQVVFNVNDGSYTGVVDILARMSVSGAGAESKSKTLSSNVAITNVAINSDNNNTASLGYADIDSLVSVIDVGNSSANVTTSFVLENGQKDNWYDHGKIRKKNDGVAITGPLTVTFKNYTHSGNGYASVNSYSGVDYEDITEYTSPTSGKIIRLADSIDFRPRRPDESGTDHKEFKTTHGTATAGAATTVTLQTSATAVPVTSATDDAYNDAVITIIDGTGKGQVRRIVDYVGSTRVATINSAWDVNPSTDSKYTIEDREFTPANVEIPYPNTNWTADYDYYLSRIDIIYLNSEGRFGLIAGVPAIDPKQPPEIDDIMSLYALYVPAYTATTGEVIVRRIDNKRYTMKDIGKIEDRVNKLEYYASLSLLEKDAQTQLVKDTAGNERFKNGIIVDNFTGHGVGDVLSEDYKTSIDFQEQVLRPPFTSNFVDLSASYDSTTSSGVTKTGDLITLSYVTKILVDQVQATKGTNLNPFAIIPWIGRLTLNPPNDYWVDTTTRPNLSINLTGDFDAWASATSLGFGTQWNDWESVNTNRTGNDAEQDFSRSVVGRNTRVINEQQTRTGIRTTIVPRTVTESLGDRVIDVNVQPFIRAQSITVTGTSLKPNSRFYPFFDGKTVATVSNSGNPIYTDQNGAVSFTFALPAGTYRTGPRIFRLINSSTNSLQSADSRAEISFYAQGLSKTRQGTTISTRVPEKRLSTVSETRTVSRTVPAPRQEFPRALLGISTARSLWDDDEYTIGPEDADGPTGQPGPGGNFFSVTEEEDMTDLGPTFDVSDEVTGQISI